jgi:hypothetical protein
MSDKMKVIAYERSRWVMGKPTGNNMQQEHVQMVKKVVKAYTHRSRHPEIQLICCSWLLHVTAEKQLPQLGEWRFSSFHI